MIVTVYRVSIPAWSSIGYGYGLTLGGKFIAFTGDHRPLRHVGEAVARANSSEELPTVMLEAWQITSCVPPVS